MVGRSETHKQYSPRKYINTNLKKLYRQLFQSHSAYEAMLSARIVGQSQIHITAETETAIPILLRHEHIFLDNEGSLVFEFTCVTEAQAWVNVMTSLFIGEDAVMVGQPTDSLVVTYHFFRFPVSLFSIVCLILDGKIFHENQQWKTRDIPLPPEDSTTIWIELALDLLLSGDVIANDNWAERDNIIEEGMNRSQRGNSRMEESQ